MVFHKQSPRGVCKIDVLKNFTNFTSKRLYQSLFLNKVAAFQAFIRELVLAIAEIPFNMYNWLE